MGRINPLVAVGLPTWGKVTVEWAEAYRNLGSPLGSTTVGLKIVGAPIAQARNEIMANAFETGADFLYFHGDDVLPPGDSIVRLLRRMWENPTVGLVTGVYWTKTWPTSPYIWRGMQRGPYLDWRTGEFIPIDYAGCDALLVRLTPELKALGPEWFSTEWLWEPDQEHPSELATEDFYFYTKCRAAGITLWCDTEVQCIHQDRTSGMLFGLTVAMPQANGPVHPLPEPGDGALVVVADIGCGRDTPYFGEPGGVKIVRFDGDETVRPDYRCDVRHLPVADGFADVVHSRHVLEHFPMTEAPAVLAEWTRILRVGGEIRVCVPNVLTAMTRILAIEAGTEPADHYPWWQVYGAQRDHRDFHGNGFTPRTLAALFKQAGCFDDVDVHEGDDGINLYATATKARAARPMALTDAWTAIAAVEGIDVAGLRAPVASAQPGPGAAASPVAPVPSHNGTAEPTWVESPAFVQAVLGGA